LRGHHGYGKTQLALALAGVLGFYTYQLICAGNPFVPPARMHLESKAACHVVDECHNLVPHLESLYEPMVDNNFIFCTNMASRLTEAFIDRCMVFRLGEYTMEELTKIVQAHSNHIPDEVAAIFAQRCRGTPRTAVNLVRKYQMLFHSYNVSTALEFFNLVGIGEMGLTPLDRRYLDALKDGQKSRRTLQALLAVDPDEFDRLERYLIKLGLITIEPRGRRLA